MNNEIFKQLIRNVTCESWEDCNISFCSKVGDYEISFGDKQTELKKDYKLLSIEYFGYNELRGKWRDLEPTNEQRKAMLEVIIDKQEEINHSNRVHEVTGFSSVDYMHFESEIFKN